MTAVDLIEKKNCTECGALLPLDCFYFISKKTGKRRGQCKDCCSEIRAAQRDLNWLPRCQRCGMDRPRSGPGRRLCQECFDTVYDEEDMRENGAHRIKLKPCPSCGAKRLRTDHVQNTSLCPICRSVPQSRRKSLRSYFNMNPREYLELLESQRGVCAICKKKPGSGKGFAIDHQHKSPSIIRGILCTPCNSLLGMARDDITRLRAAANYLETPPAQVVFPGREANEAANTRKYAPTTRKWK